MKSLTRSQVSQMNSGTYISKFFLKWGFKTSLLAVAGLVNAKKIEVKQIMRHFGQRAHSPGLKHVGWFQKLHVLVKKFKSSTWTNGKYLTCLQRGETC